MADLADLTVDTIRTLSIDAVGKANSGHPGTPLSLAPLAYCMWAEALRHDPACPEWVDRDRFVLSAGHASMLLYATLHVFGYPVSIDDIKAFRQWGSPTAGHPEHEHVPGVDVTTGPLGQGIANSVGFALAERMLNARFGSVVDHRTWVIASDGDMMEGLSHEAGALAGHLRLGRLNVVYDDNKVSLSAPTSVTMSDDTATRFESYGWHVQTVADGEDRTAIATALGAAKDELDRPSLILLRTQIGYGSPAQNTWQAHGNPLNADDIRATKRTLGWPEDESFLVPSEVLDHCAALAQPGTALRRQWDATFSLWRERHPTEASEWDRVMARRLPDGWDVDLPVFDTDPAGMASRDAAGKAMSALADRLPEIIGGSADLDPSTKTHIGPTGKGDVTAEDFSARNIQFGVREHAMGAIANGLSLHGGFRPFTATFFMFYDYMKNPIRLAALMRQPVVFVFTHDSIGVGEDGPTHQPIENLAALRAVPNTYTYRPGDANEAVVAWRCAIERTDAPSVLVLSRQKLPTLDRAQLGSADGLAQGGYVLKHENGTGMAAVVLVATGSEVALALAAAERLEADAISTRVVSLPCWRLFDEQPEAYRDSVIPVDVPARVAIEAASPLGWERYVGPAGASVTLDRFGASAPDKVIFDKLGFSVDAVVSAAKGVLKW